MDKLVKIDEFLKFFPKQSLDDIVPAKQGKNKKKHKNKAIKQDNEKKIMSLSQIKDKVKEKIGSFRTNQGKRKQRKERRERGKTKFIGEGIESKTKSSNKKEERKNFNNKEDKVKTTKNKNINK
jgi:hypothetical protein